MMISLKTEKLNKKIFGIGIKMNIIVATDIKGGISRKGKLPWWGSYPEDMSFFQMMTFGKRLIVGRKTFEDMGPLLGRKLLVVSSKADSKRDSPGVKWCRNFSEAYNRLGSNKNDHFVIGGESIYQQAFDLNTKYGDVISNVYVTQIPFDYNCDQFFSVPVGFTNKGKSLLGLQGVSVSMYINNYVLKRYKDALRADRDGIKNHC